jgi:tetratricopeptide (TPR) repeat protein
VRAAAAAALLVFVYWAVHGSLDWFWEIPGLGAPAFAFLGGAAAVAQRDTRRDGPPSWAPYPIAAACVAAVLAAAPAWLAARQIEASVSGWRDRPEASLDGLDDASRLNPLSERADLLAGAIANRTGRSVHARSVLQRAISRNAVNWYTHFELAVAETSLGRRDAALAALARAAELNPREEVIRDARSRVAQGEMVDLADVDATFRQRVESRTR